ncbi:MAG: AAA family ATPase [Thermoanaerobaculia bacterium]
MLRRISLRNYKSFVDAELNLAPLSVIFGPNDAGKSNLLDAFSLLSELVEVDSLTKAFDPKMHRGEILEAFHSPAGFGEQGIQEIRNQGQLELQLEVDIELQERIRDRINELLKERERLAQAEAYTRVAETRLRYCVGLRYDFKTGEPFVFDERLAALTRTGEEKQSRSAFIEFDASKRRFIARVERQSHPRYFADNRNRTLLSELSDPVYHPHVVAAKQEIRSWLSYYIEPSLVREERGVHGADDPGHHGEELAAFYWKLKHEHPTGFKAVSLNLRRLIPSLHAIDVREAQGRLHAVVIQRGGAEFPFRLASEGTLRLLCLLAIAIAPNPPAMVAYEEPENGVQPGRLDILADILKGIADRGRTQVILTTHSPTLLERLTGGRFISCRRDQNGHSVFSAYEKQDRIFAAQDLEEDLGEVTSLDERLLRGEFQ